MELAVEQEAVVAAVAVAAFLTGQTATTAININCMTL
jgi:hypothetical protein